MKILVSVLLLLITNLISSQGRYADFRDVDERVKSIDADRLDTLASRLTAPYATDLQKIRSIFRWIAEHISYKTDYPVRVRRSSKSNMHEEPDDTSSVLKPLSERVAEGVLKRKEAVCDGYARLFKTLCDYAGIQSEIITGYARGNSAGKYFRANHSWNAVLIDSSWHLLDVTWASGFTTFNSNQFVKFFDDRYFLTPPQDFIADHYPEDQKWALLSHPPIIREFYHTPFQHSGFRKFRINSFYPSRGIIEASVGDSITIELETDDVMRNLRVSETPYIDSVLSSVWWDIPNRPSVPSTKQKVNHTYVVASDAVEWLYVIYNDEVVLRYKLNIRKDLAEK